MKSYKTECTAISIYVKFDDPALDRNTPKELAEIMFHDAGYFVEPHDVKLITCQNNPYDHKFLAEYYVKL